MTSTHPESSRGHDPAVEPLRPDASIGELVGELTRQLGDLFRQEVELAKTEAKHEARRAGAAVGKLALAAVFALTALLLASMALAWLLDQALNRALAFLIVAALWVLVAGVLAARGRQDLAAVRPFPITTETLQEDAQWIKHPTG